MNDAKKTQAPTRDWSIERDAEGIAWLTFDKAGASTNTLSAEALEALRAILRELSGATGRAGEPSANNS